MSLSRSPRIGAVAAALLSCAAVLSSCTIDEPDTGSASGESSSPTAVAQASDAEIAPRETADENSPALAEASVTFRSVGDILIHNEVYFDAAANAQQRAANDTSMNAGGDHAQSGAAQGYDFAPMLAPVAKYLRNADITTANMEVFVAGPAFELSGYPAFNSPPQIVDALKDAGVDIVNNATNHSMDRGPEGVKASTSNLRERGMLYMGSFASPQDRATPRIIERNGLKVGFLAYTYGTNGIPVPVGE